MADQTLDINGTYRLPEPQSPGGQDIVVTVDGGDEVPQFDEGTGTTQFTTPDGEVTVTFGPPTPACRSSDFDANLTEHLSEAELSTIAERLLEGIAIDDQSRSAWLENMAAGISLLGLEIKSPQGAASTGSTTEGGSISDVTSPLLLEAVLRFQANARGELLPADGPVKVRNDGDGGAANDQLARALEKDMNHYLTKVATEYYPDTDRMLLLLGFCGISFKKGFHDALKRRPVIASIDAKDLIVSNTSTNLDSAGRVTHRIMMRSSMLKRMQMVGAYRKTAIPESAPIAQKNVVDEKIDQTQGIAPAIYQEPADQDRELYECYCEVEIPGFEHRFDGESTGIPLPYKITIDREARRVLEIRRNWHEDDAFVMPINRIVAYMFVPGLGFYSIGLLNILGNATRAMTAAWRLMLDAGMFANFPGFLFAKSLGKQLTNQFRVPPGAGAPIDTLGQDIRASIMPLPYKDPSAVFIQFIDSIAANSQRVGGTAELQVGDGRQDAPVGTTLALIEQATKIMSAVHKRMHQAQGQELDMLKSLLSEDPEALWRHNRKSAVLKCLQEKMGQQPIVDEQEKSEEIRRQIFVAALADFDLVPASDPNTSSQTERYLKCVALRQMAASNPSLDINKIDERALKIMGFDDAASLFKPPAPAGGPSPEQVIAQASAMAAAARLKDSQTREVEVGIKGKELATKALNIDLTHQKGAAEMAARERIASLGVVRELVVHGDDLKLARDKLAQTDKERYMDRVARLAMVKAQQRGVADQRAVDRAFDAAQSSWQRGVAG